ncbi:MAG: sugar phosphate isomerase/epimerase [Armatimonadetes bacterium]|nr:sugar phosphate isomerase/epimerase [Armatimonadota bacterium]
MIKCMHGLSTMHCNIVTEIRMAKETGFDALEILDLKMKRYIEAGCDPRDLVPIFQKYGIKPVTINAIKDIERVEGKERDELMAETELMCSAAETIGCKTIQLVQFCGLEDRPQKEVMDLTADVVRDIADIGKSHGVRFQLEPIAWSPIHSLWQSLDLIDMVGRDNVRMVIDFWHLWAGWETGPEDVAKLPKDFIYSVHFCDGVRPPKGTPSHEWTEMAYRSYLPGEGDIPVREWVDAVKSTGFDGVWSSELLSAKHWEWDLVDIANETRERMEKYID